MRTALPTLVIGVVALAGAVSTAPAEATDGHKIVQPQQVEWRPGPAVIPQGAEAAVLFGDPTKEGPFTLRLKLPKGYHIAPHTHPKPEVVTVLSGTFRLGMGEAADRGRAEPLPAGSFVALPPGMAHYVFADEDTVVQINTSGPWGLTYVNPKDDPRQKTQ
jgi:quercetin dioxygenase-like cupin family protein